MQGEILASQGKISSDLDQKPYEGFVQRLLGGMPLPCARQDSYQLWGHRAKSSVFGNTVFVFVIDPWWIYQQRLSDVFCK